MGVRELVDRELGAVAPKPKLRALSLAELAALPITKKDLAHEATEFAEARKRAELKGNRARELFNSPQCLPDPATVREWAKDFEPTK